jgi:putative aminopeptidase FrvX
MGRFEPGFARLRVVALLALAGFGLPPAARTADLPAAQLADELEAFLRVPAVAGREARAAAFIRGRLAAPTESRGPAAAEDALGNVISSVGSGAPRKLIACALGEPGFAVSRIEDDGYLRLVPVGGAIPAGALWEQAHEGQTVMVAGARGDVPGAVTPPLRTTRRAPCVHDS